jgi:signal transduction histidine kinase
MLKLIQIGIAILSCITTAAQTGRSIDLIIKDTTTAELYKQKIPAAIKAKDYRRAGYYHKLISDYYYKHGVNDSMIYYITQSLREYEKVKDTFYIYYARFRIVDAALTNTKNPEAEKFLMESAMYFLRTKEYIMAVNSYYVLSRYYTSLQNQQQHEYYLQKAFEQNQFARDTNMQIILLRSRCYNEQAAQNWTKAIATAEESLHLSKRIKSDHFIKTTLVMLGVLYYKTCDYVKATSTFEKAVRIKAVEPNDQLTASAYLVRCYQKTGHTAAASLAFEKYVMLKDSIEQKKIAENYRELILKYESERKQAALLSLEKENQLNSQVAAARKKWIIILLIFILTVVPVSIFAFYNFRKRQQLEKLNELRNKISRDLHDEVGATLSSIQVYSSVAAKAMDQNQQQARDALDRIFRNTEQAMENMNDIVWAIKTYTSGVATLTDKLKNYGYEILAPRGINCTYNIDPEVESKLTNIEARKNILLIAKEAINNAARHSGASELSIEVKNENGFFELLVKDNGTGITSAQPFKGNGIMNIKKRTELLSGIFTITENPAGGTIIHCKIPFTNISDGTIR